MKDLTDYELIQKYNKGDEKSLEILIARYIGLVRGFVQKFTGNAQNADDITQEVFLKLWRNVKRIDKNKNFKSWLFTVAKNTALDFLKKKKTVPFSSFEDMAGKNVLMEVLADKAKLPNELSQMRERRNIFSKAIGSLSVKYKTILSLYYYEYLNFREIAETLSEPINTIKSRHRRGLAMLKKVLRVAPNESHYPY